MFDGSISVSLRSFFNLRSEYLHQLVMLQHPLEVL
jgi:hypothetical protein